PGEFRGGLGVQKGGTLYACERTVVSYCCDRERSITWGLWGGLPSIPHGVWVNQGKENERYLGSLFSGVPLKQGDTVQRPSAGGGGLGDPLRRDPDAVLKDVVEGYVSIARAKKDYGVVVVEVDADLCEYRLDSQATLAERARIAAHRKGWLDQDPEEIARRYRSRELDMFDLIRQYGVIVDWGSGELLAETTADFRDMLKRRTVPYWSADKAASATLKIA
ncbi:MAG TPA: hydantoinase B/oxoprolinase family protein, partial [Hyphomicrobium sp.]|nr:hydantoinase B/oxoprolinase family protein [Hyphomicrobium sp.]